jgi:hypothetical protein
MVNTDSPYDFLWRQQSLFPEIGGLNQSMYLYGGCYLSGESLIIPGTPAFPESKISNLSNYNYWASTKKGTLGFDFLYESGFTNNAVLFFLDGKATGASQYDSNDSIGVRTNQATTVPGVSLRYTSDNGNRTLNTPAANIISGTSGTWYPVKVTWNANAERNLTIQVTTGDNVPAYITGAFGPTKCAAWHQILCGNDSALSFAHRQRNHYITSDWTYDLVGTFWQDFEFDSITTGNLNDRDHAASGAWVTLGNTSRYSTSTDGEYTNPSIINNANDTGVKGIRNDLNSTNAASIGWTFLNSTSAFVFGFWLKTANLASNTSGRAAFCSENPANNTVVAVEQRNLGGQHQMYLRNNAGIYSQMVNVSPDTWYWNSVYAKRNDVCRLQVYNISGLLVGNEVVTTGSNNSIGSVRLGSLSTNVAQSAGVYHYIDDFVFDSSSNVYPLKPWATNG